MRHPSPALAAASALVLTACATGAPNTAPQCEGAPRPANPRGSILLDAAPLVAPPAHSEAHGDG